MKKTIYLVLLFISLPLFILSIQGQKSNYLINYFSVPERHTIDASTGASKKLVDGKMYGTTHYSAEVIAPATGCTRSEIKTKYAYTTKSHKALIDYATPENKTQVYPEIA